MKSFIFDLITSPLSLFENPIHNYIAMAVIGAIAFAIAFRAVGELGLRGEAGSIAHWIIRLFVFVFIWLLCCVAIKIITFIINNWLVIIISIVLLLIVYLMKKYADSHPDSILNKKLFYVLFRYCYINKYHNKSVNSRLNRQ